MLMGTADRGLTLASPMCPPGNSHATHLCSKLPGVAARAVS
jgi:hypothetical protein